MAELNEDGKLIHALMIELAADPENFSEWENDFVDSLNEQLARNGDGFGLTIKQRKVCEKLQQKAKEA